MKLTAGIQEALLCVLCYDDRASIVEACVAHDQFDPVFREIAAAAIDYRRQHGQVPGEHTLDIVDTICARDEPREKLFRRLFDSMSRTREGINVEYVIGQASRFAKMQKMKRCAADAIAAIEKGDPDEAEAAMALATKREAVDLFDPGTFLFDPVRSLRFMDDDYEAFPTGIPRLDRVGLGPARKALHLLIGLTGMGKSWWLIHLMKQAVLHGLKVAYVSLEMSEEKICRRAVQSFFGISKHESRALTIRFKTSEEGTFLSSDKKHVDVMTLRDPDAREKIAAKMRRLKNRPSPVIKDFPTKSLTVGMLQGYLDTLEATRRFIPDLICVDYGAIMAPERSYKERRHELGDIYERLRGVAVDRNIAVATVSQAHRAAMKTKLITKENVAEDWSQTGTADVVLTFNQTPGEHKRKLARIFVAKGREDSDKFRVLISQNYSIGAFCFDSANPPSEKSYWERIDEDEDE